MDHLSSDWDDLIRGVFIVAILALSKTQKCLAAENIALRHFHRHQRPRNGIWISMIKWIYRARYRFNVQKCLGHKTLFGEVHLR